MSDTRIEPHKIKSPIQLLAVWFAALVLIDSAFLIAAAKVPSPPWVAPTLSIAAIAFVPVFLIAAVVLQIKYRPQLQEDMYYAEWLERQELLFGDFEPENEPLQPEPMTPVPAGRACDGPEERRVQRYRDQEGLFLVHAWRPSELPGQVADVIVWLHQHKAGPLTRGEVEKVEYHLGPMFFDEPVEKTNSAEHFRLEISAYYPVLCLARVYVRGCAQPIELERYLDFYVPAGGNEEVLQGAFRGYSDQRALAPPQDA